MTLASQMLGILLTHVVRIGTAPVNLWLTRGFFALDKHIPNEKELIRPRRLCLRREIPEPGAQNFACGANYLAARWFNFACGANCPYQALKGGYFYLCG